MILFRNKIYTGLSLLIFTLIMGTVGFRFFGDYSLTEALYMTVITISTVGFEEVHPSNDTLKIFTIILIIFGFLVFTLLVSVFTEHLATITHENIFLKKNKRMIKKLKNHIIVFGYGRTGKETVEILNSYKKNLVVVEIQDITLPKIKGVHFLKYNGDVSNEDILIDAGVKNAEYLIITLPNDAENLFLILSAKQLNPNVKIISRASKIGSESKMRFAGVDETVLTNKIGGKHFAYLLLFPTLINFLDMISDGNSESPFLEEVTINDSFSSSQTIIDLDIRNKTGCNVIAYITPDKKHVINPEGDTVLIPNSKIIVIGNLSQIKKATKLFNGNNTAILAKK